MFKILCCACSSIKGTFPFSQNVNIIGKQFANWQITDYLKPEASSFHSSFLCLSSSLAGNVISPLLSLHTTHLALHERRKQGIIKSFLGRTMSWKSHVMEDGILEQGIRTERRKYVNHDCLSWRQRRKILIVTWFQITFKYADSSHFLE